MQNPVENVFSEIGGDNDDEFNALQHLSKADLKKVINFLLKSAAEATAAATQSISSSAPMTTQKTLTLFNQNAIIFKVANEISGDEIP